MLLVKQLQSRAVASEMSKKIVRLLPAFFVWRGVSVHAYDVHVIDKRVYSQSASFKVARHSTAIVHSFDVTEHVWNFGTNAIRLDH